MFIKYNKSLKDLDYIVAFDLALYNTGVSIYSIEENKIINTWMIHVDKNEIKPATILYYKLYAFLEKIIDEFGNNIMILQESLPQQAGRFTTVATLQGLAKAHAMLELAVDIKDLEFYDEKGVHSISVKSVFKNEETPKPTKRDIKKAVCAIYNLEENELTDDQSDSVALIYTLLNKKWNSDIDTKIKEIKKEIKTLKNKKTIEEREEEIAKLLTFKIN